MKSDVSLLRRLGAIGYDILLSFSLAFFVIFITVIFFDTQSQNNKIFYLITLPSIYLYFTISWVKGRQTLGMKAWKFKVVQQNGNNITHKQALIRFVTSLFSFMIIGFGFLYQLFNQDQLTLHDIASNTVLRKS